MFVLSVSTYPVCVSRHFLYPRAADVMATLDEHNKLSSKADLSKADSITHGLPKTLC